MQSSTALKELFKPLEFRRSDPHDSFAAVRFVCRRLDSGGADHPGQTFGVAGGDVIWPKEAIASVDVRDASSSPCRVFPRSTVGNLPGALSRYAEFRRIPGILGEEHREYGDDLGLLSERSSAILSDTGCGMTRAQFRSLAEGAGRCTDGHGLGFCVVKELAEMPGGRWASASRAKGRRSASNCAVKQIDIEAQTTSRRATRGPVGWIGC